MDGTKMISKQTHIAVEPVPQRLPTNTVPAQDVRRRGVGAIVEKLEGGPVHVFQYNRPAFVALREEHYRELLAEIEEARCGAPRAQDPATDRTERFKRLRGVSSPDRQALARSLLATVETPREPIGAEAVQRMGAKTSLERDELSRSLIRAREE